MQTFLALLASKLAALLYGALVGWIGKVIHNWQLKKQAKDETKKAIDNAEKNNDTSGMFNPK